MVQEFILQGLDCPNCAAKSETEVNTISDVTVLSVANSLRLIAQKNS